MLDSNKQKQKAGVFAFCLFVCFYHREFEKHCSKNVVVKLQSLRRKLLVSYLVLYKF